MSGLDFTPGPDKSGAEHTPSPPPDPDDANPREQAAASAGAPAMDPDPPAADPHPPAANPYPPGALPYPPGAGPYPPSPGAYPPPPPYGAPYPYGPPQTGNGFAVTALVVGLVSLFVSWFPIVNWVFAAVAIIFGALGISTAGRRGGAGKGMAVAGLVLGLVTAGLGIIFWAVIYGGFAGSQCAYGC